MEICDWQGLVMWAIAGIISAVILIKGSQRKPNYMPHQCKHNWNKWDTVEKEDMPGRVFQKRDCEECGYTQMEQII